MKSDEADGIDELPERHSAHSTVYLSPNNDTVGESFELNAAAAQEAGTLIKTARLIILAQGSVWEKWNYSYSRTTHVGSIFSAGPVSICLK